MHQPVPQLALDQQFCFALYSASRALIRAYGPLLEPLGLTYPQYVTMLAIWEATGPLTVGDLRLRVGLDNGTLTPLLKRLEQSSFIERHRDPVDERRVLITTTPTGQALREEAARIPLRLHEHLQIDISTAVALREQLKELTATIKRAHTPDDRLSTPAPSHVG